MRHVDPRTRARPYGITRTQHGWAVWDRRRYIGTGRPGEILGEGWPITVRLHPTHAAAIAALDAHLREQATMEASA